MGDIAGRETRVQTSGAMGMFVSCSRCWLHGWMEKAEVLGIEGWGVRGHTGVSEGRWPQQVVSSAVAEPDIRSNSRCLLLFLQLQEVGMWKTQ